MHEDEAHQNAGEGDEEPANIQKKGDDMAATTPVDLKALISDAVDASDGKLQARVAS